MAGVEQNVGLRNDLQRVKRTLQGLVEKEDAELRVAVHVDDVVVEDATVPLLRKPNSVPLVHLRLVDDK